MTLPCLTCTLNVYDRDLVTLRDSLTGHGVQIVDDLGMEGGAQLSASMWEDALQTDPELFREAVVKVQSDLGAGEVEFAAFLSQIGTGQLIGDEKAGEELSPAGRGLLGFFADWRLAHEKGWLEKDISSDGMRYFGPMSGFFDDSGWDTPLAVNWYDDTSARAGWPAQMLDLDQDADWIGVTDPESDSVPKGTINWFRKQFTLADEVEVKGWFTADNYARVFVDSELIWDGTADLYNWKGLAEWSAILPAGTYTIAARVENAALTSGENPIGFLATFWELDSSGNPDTLLTHTDTSWTCFDATSDPAGVTVGETLLELMAEATARGIPSVARLNPTFTATLDSDGATLPVDEERSWQIGETSGLDIVLSLGETSCDIEVTPDGDLNLYLSQGTDLSGTIELEEGVNLLSLNYDGEPRNGTRAITKGQDGTVEVISDEIEEDFDAREDYLQAGGAITRQQTIKVAVRSLEDTARDRVVYTAEVVGLTGCVPMKDFFKGSTITAPDMAKTPAPMVVTSITGTFPDSGGPWRWTIEYEAPE